MTEVNEQLRRESDFRLAAVVAGSVSMLSVSPDTVGIPDSYASPIARAVLFLNEFTTDETGESHYPYINPNRVAGARLGAGLALGQLMLHGLRDGQESRIRGVSLTGMVAKYLPPPDQAAVWARAKLRAGQYDIASLLVIQSHLLHSGIRFAQYFALEKHVSELPDDPRNIRCSQYLGGRLPHARWVADMLADAGVSLHTADGIYDGEVGDRLL
jgi:hypothetical protein